MVGLRSAEGSKRATTASLAGTLDAIYGAAADLDALAGGINQPRVRELLDDA